MNANFATLRDSQMIAAVISNHTFDKLIVLNLFYNRFCLTSVFSKDLPSTPTSSSLSPHRLRDKGIEHLAQNLQVNKSAGVIF